MPNINDIVVSVFAVNKASGMRSKESAQMFGRRERYAFLLIKPVLISVD